MRWFDRPFTLGMPTHLFPNVVERVRGTPARLEERIETIDPGSWSRAADGRWSIQENVGHLLDLEPLWLGRLQDLEEGHDVLREADLENRKTHEAAHDHTEMTDLLARFRAARAEIVEHLDALGSGDLERTALHPRLKQPMTVTDLFFFVAEHDDHHLARITAIAREAADG